MLKDPLKSIHRSQTENSYSKTTIYYTGFSVEEFNSVPKKKKKVCLFSADLGTLLLEYRKS